MYKMAINTQVQTHMHARTLLSNSVWIQYFVYGNVYGKNAVLAFCQQETYHCYDNQTSDVRNDPTDLTKITQKPPRTQ